MSDTCDRQLRKRDQDLERARIASIRETIASTTTPITSSSHIQPPSMQQYREPNLGPQTPTATPHQSAPPLSFNSPSIFTSSLPELAINPGVAAWVMSRSDSEGHASSSRSSLPMNDNLGGLFSSMARMEPNQEPELSEQGREPCPGVLVEWEAGSVWETYPYHRHAGSQLPWEPVTFENDRWLRIRSIECDGFIQGQMQASCLTCSAVPTSAQFRAVMDRAISAGIHTPWMVLTFKQLHAKLQKTMAKFRQLRLKVSSG